jgi:tRNA 2-thiocytidine biosynthesis protein TtcA
VDLEKILLRKVGEAVAKFKMIRDGDRVAVALSGGKDSLTMLDALLLLQKRAPVDFTVCAFTVEQGKFLRPFEPMAEYLKSRGIDWSYHRDNPSFRLLEEQPEHGCDLCSRYRRRAVFEIARGLGANVIAFGHTADDVCESFLRNALFNGRISALPAITWSREKGPDREVRRINRRAGDPVRLFAAHWHCPAILTGFAGWSRSGTSSSSRDAAFGDGQH